jgi:hypothetical protein
MARKPSAGRNSAGFNAWGQKAAVSIDRMSVPARLPWVREETARPRTHSRREIKEVRALSAKTWKGQSTAAEQ